MSGSRHNSATPDLSEYLEANSVRKRKGPRGDCLRSNHHRIPDRLFPVDCIILPLQLHSYGTIACVDDVMLVLPFEEAKYGLVFLQNPLCLFLFSRYSTVLSCIYLT